MLSADTLHICSLVGQPDSCHNLHPYDERLVMHTLLMLVDKLKPVLYWGSDTKLEAYSWPVMLLLS